MTPETDIHSIQASIMRQLYRRGSLRFAELNIDKLPSDQFSHHVRQLIKTGVLEKDGSGLYSLTVIGRTRAVMLYPDKDSYIAQGFVAVRVVLFKQEAGTRLVLLQERMMDPYRGKLGTPGDKIYFGENVADTAKRAMLSQTGFECKVQLKGMCHFRDIHRGQIAQDKYFFIFEAQYQLGRLLEIGVKGNRNTWVPYEVVQTSPKVMPGTIEMIQTAEHGSMKLDERTFEFDYY